MIRTMKSIDHQAPVLLLDIGNTNTRIAVWDKHLVKAPVSVSTGDQQPLNDAVSAHLSSYEPAQVVSAVVASVVPGALPIVRDVIGVALGREPLIVGEEIALPIEVGIEDPRSMGVDRICAAAAAYHALQAACTVVDFGSAVTVDLVDGEGTLLGGAILPGLTMQLRSLHEHAAQLPKVEIGLPDSVFGCNTVEAIQIGVCRGLIGAVRNLVESYATSLNQWPQVVATGGDLMFIGPQCDFLDSLVPDLTLRGLGLSYTRYLEARGA